MGTSLHKSHNHVHDDTLFDKLSAINIYLFIISIILIIFSLATLILITYSLCKHPTNHKKPSTKKEPKIKSVDYPTICSATCYSIACWTFIIVLYHFDPNDENNFSDDCYFTMTMLIFATFIFMAKLSNHAQFVARIYWSFKNSVLAINKSTIIISVILLCLLSFFIIWWIIIISMRHLILRTDFSSYREQFCGIFTGLIIFDLCLSWYIVGLFINKLYKVLLFKCRSEFFKRAERTLVNVSNANNNIINDQSIDIDADIDSDIDEDESVSNNHQHYPSKKELLKSESLILDIIGACIDENDERTLDLITKQCVLSSLSILTTQLVYITFLIILAMNGTDEKKSRLSHLDYIILYWLFGGVYYPMHVILGCIVLYFNYKFAIKYYKCFCKCCHHRCNAFVVQRAAKKIQDKYYEGGKLKDDADSLEL